MTDDIKKYLLSQLTAEDLKELVTGIVEDSIDPPVSVGTDNAKLTQSQKFYRTRKIPGSSKRCTTCGQDLVNDEEHAKELLGGEKE